MPLISHQAPNRLHHLTSPLQQQPSSPLSLPTASSTTSLHQLHHLLLSFLQPSTTTTTHVHHHNHQPSTMIFNLQQRTPPAPPRQSQQPQPAPPATAIINHIVFTSSSSSQQPTETSSSVLHHLSFFLFAFITAATAKLRPFTKQHQHTHVPRSSHLQLSTITISSSHQPTQFISTADQLTVAATRSASTTFSPHH